jgi:hypothetical protein
MADFQVKLFRLKEIFVCGIFGLRFFLQTVRRLKPNIEWRRAQASERCMRLFNVKIRLAALSCALLNKRPFSSLMNCQRKAHAEHSAAFFALLFHIEAFKKAAATADLRGKGERWNHHSQISLVTRSGGGKYI